MKGYSWSYFEKNVLAAALKQNPYKRYYYKIQGKDIHPSFWKDDVSSVMRVTQYQEIEITQEERKPFLKV